MREVALTYGELPDYGTFERLFDLAVGREGVYHCKAGLSGLFVGTPHALGHGDSEAYTALGLYQVLEACVKAGAEAEDAKAAEDELLPTLGIPTDDGDTWPQCLQDAASVLETLGIEWI